MSGRAMGGRGLAGIALAMLGACSGTNKASEPPLDARREAAKESAAPEPAWTTAFPKESVLIANRIEVVGPRSMISRLAIAQDPVNHSHDETATPEGMRIEEERLAESDEPIAAQIDHLTLRAMDRLVVLLSPNARQVTIQATGDVYFRVVDTGEEKRGDALRLEGAR